MNSSAPETNNEDNDDNVDLSSADEDIGDDDDEEEEDLERSYDRRRGRTHDDMFNYEVSYR